MQRQVKLSFFHFLRNIHLFHGKIIPGEDDMVSNKNRNKKHKQKKKLRLPVIFILVALISYIFSFIFLNKYEMVLTLKGDNPLYVEYGEEWEDPGVNAYEKNAYIGFIKSKVTPAVSDNITDQLGEFTITYHAKTNRSEAEIQRKVIVQDTTAPVIELLSNPDTYTPFNHPYVEEGLTAIDNYDGDISLSVTSEEKDGKVYYSVTDSSGNTATAEREIVYDDRMPPVISLEDGGDILLEQWSQYTDRYTAEDDCDGDVTSNVTVEGSVDTAVPGNYTLTYTVSDSHDNQAVITRTVHVIEKSDDGTIPDRSKIIYLTFDDGPGQYTDELLDILDKYNVKVTFFTTSAYPAYAYCMKRAAEAGHTVAVHTATHNYATIYASDDAYWADFDRQNDAIAAQTGSRTTFFRFPGGSSNTISANYNQGIMSRLAQEAEQKGYQYFDWNVTSGDAGETTDTQVVFTNVTTQIASNTEYGRSSVVLQHDVKDYSVAAVEDIIKWGKENGYAFLPISAGSPTAHHPINN